MCRVLLCAVIETRHDELSTFAEEVLGIDVV
jgi:hypothetical protein